jgi:hypothetical protein
MQTIGDEEVEEAALFIGIRGIEDEDVDDSEFIWKGGWEVRSHTIVSLLKEEEINVFPSGENTTE